MRTVWLAKTLIDESAGLTCMYDDGLMSICPHCGFLLGVFIPGMPCPSCGETLLPNEVAGVCPPCVGNGLLWQMTARAATLRRSVRGSQFLYWGSGFDQPRNPWFIA